MLNDSSCGKLFPVRFNMPGLFNVANSIAAIIACNTISFGEHSRVSMKSDRGMGIKPSLEIGDCVSSLQDFLGVRGRCEVIHDGDFTVICDYAHTQDALIKILTCIRQFVKKRIICLFGAAGERDSDKRPSMGATAAEYSDFLIITSDNPRFEDPEVIIRQVVSGIPENALPYSTFVDRKEAIEFALSQAKKDDIVLLAGKGHETYQVIGNDYMAFDERKIVKEFLGEQHNRSGT
jgi:UDP-N-acetylmuramoyl-L-alanyl-D-glutamate--2,6-diaminopimelate ligase